MSDRRTYVPSGTVTLLFTDIEGSTTRWERFGEGMNDAVRRHDALLRDAIESNGGYVFKTVGDAFCAAFTDVAQALTAALEVQRDIAAADFSAVEGIRVRMAVHVGACEERDGDYFGPTVNRVARLLSTGHGGQVLFSAAAANLASSTLPAGCALVDLGLHRLKDLSQPERIANLTGPGLLASFPPLHSLSTTANNLPRYLSPIVGREAEIAAVKALLQHAQVVTIAATGGVGKTRLAVQVAADAIEENNDGTWFVDLAPVTDPALVVATVATAIGIELEDTSDALSALSKVLKTRRMLIVLDNCEHVMEQAARVADTLARACPNVHILATSREPLGIAGESVYRLDTLDDESAVALFVARAQQVDQRFVLNERDRPIALEICHRLDGIALAIELAAGRAHVMPLPQLLARLSERFRVLTGGSRTALPRQQTMRALIDWSYDLLAEQERAFFRRLGVFRGGFSLDAASRVASDTDIEGWEVVDRLSALLDKSMVVLSGNDNARYRMLESIRDYALERLREDLSEEGRVRRSHAEFFSDLSAEASASYGFDSEETWLAHYDADIDNFRAALDWSLDADPQLAAQIVAKLRGLWGASNLVTEGLARSEAALAALEPSAEDVVTLPLLLAVASLAGQATNERRSFETGERALAMAERVGDATQIAEAKRSTGSARYILGDDRERAIRELQEAAEFFRTVDPPLRALLALTDYAITLAFERDRIEGRRLLLEALSEAHNAGWPRTAVRIETNLAELEFQNGQVALAAERAHRVVDAARTRKAPFALALALANLGSYLCVDGKYDEALAVGLEAATIARSNEHRFYLALSLQCLAVGLAARRDATTAARLLGYVDMLYERSGAVREPTEAAVQERLFALLREGLSDAAIGDAIQAGRTLSMNAACALAFGAAVQRGAAG